MNALLILSVLLAAAYGVLTALAGYGELRQPRLQTWAAAGTLLAGFALLAAAGLLAYRSPAALAVLVIGLLGMHALAINNAYRLFGRLTPSHHLVRLAISLLVFALGYLALR